MNDECKHKAELESASESVGQDGQVPRKKPRIPAFLSKPVSETAGDIAVEIERRCKKRGW